MHDLILPILPLAIGFIVGSAFKQIVIDIYHFFFDIKETALMVKESGILMVKETYETAVMLLRSSLDKVLIPILDQTKAIFIIMKPILDLVVIVIKTLILILQSAVAIVYMIVKTGSILLTSILSSIHTIATNATQIASEWLVWLYEGSSSTFSSTVFYLIGIYLVVQLLLLATKRLLKKIK